MKTMKHIVALHIFTSRVHHDFTNIRELIDISECHLKSEIKRLEERVTEEIQNTPEDEKEFTIGWYADDFVCLDKVYPNIQRRALFTTLMGMVEADMLLGCRICRRAFNFPKEFKNKGNTRMIVQAMDYLRTHLTIRERLVKTQWNFIQNLWLIRNAIVHNDGKPKPSNLKAVSEFCEPIPTIELDHHNRIILKEGSVQIALHYVNQFFSRLIDEIKKNELPQQDI